MNKKIISIRLLLLPLLSFGLLTSCGSENIEPHLQAPLEHAVSSATNVDDQDSDEFTKTEYFDKNKEKIKYFLGEFKDAPDPVFDPSAPLKLPNQEDVTALLTYMRKRIDSLEGGGPNPEILKSDIFMNEDGKIDFNKLLNKFRFKPIFKDVSFSIPPLTSNRAKGVPGFKPVRYTSLFKNLIMENILFDSVKLDDIDASGAEMNIVTIANSTYNRLICLRCAFNNVYFDNSIAKDADFSFSTGHLEFDDNKITFLKITDSNFDKLAFNGGTLQNSVFINSGKIEIDSNVKTFNNVTDDTVPGSLQQKPVGLVFEDTFPGGTGTKVLNIIRDHQLQPIKIEYALEKALDEEALLKETETLQKKALELNDDNSIAKRMLEIFRKDPGSYPETAILERMAKGYVSKIDSLIIPGGLDIEPYFYDRNISAEEFYKDLRPRLKAKKNVEAEEFPIRTLLEIFLLDLSIEKQIPLLMVCRGAHIYNIWKGGKMLENLPDIYDYVNFDAHLRFIKPYANLKDEDKNHRLLELFQKEGKKPVAVYGNHHQAIDPDNLGRDLRILMVWELPKRGFIPYALFDSSYAPGVWLVQFHPEVKEELGGAMARQLSNINAEIYDSFFDLMKARKLPTVPDEKATPALRPIETEAAPVIDEALEPQATPAPAA